ncbi:MAG: ATP-binding cassette domain-containing protein [Bacteroidales bacterium]|jgi:ABC-type Fe3+/spermidine/putrescine transport system ATPase subunit|nr:ATP-binding cassette domain-containing protein [Bacteroidales bacterium]
MLELKNINISFGQFSISNVNMKLEKGDYFVLLGPSGAGKSIILELIAGILRIDSGDIYLSDKNITREKIQNRSVGLVFQDFAIFPHLNVEQNIAYPLKVKRWPKEKIRNRVEQLAKQMDIFHLLSRKTISLSGGEKQRVALARTLALSPDLLLLDEPLASLDIQLKKELRSQLRKLHKLGQTIIHVTHDFEEALLLADKVAIFNQGQIIQQGIKNEVFAQPQSEFIAHFIGVKNYFEVSSIGSSNIEVAEKLNFVCKDQRFGHQKPKALMIHSGDILLSKTNIGITRADNTFIGVITDIYPAYRGFELMIDIGLPLVVNISQKQLMQLDVKEGDKLECFIAPENIQKISDPKQY